MRRDFVLVMGLGCGAVSEGEGTWEDRSDRLGRLDGSGGAEEEGKEGVISMDGRVDGVWYSAFSEISSSFPALLFRESIRVVDELVESWEALRMPERVNG